MVNYTWRWLIGVLIIIITFIYLLDTENTTTETIKYFPINQSISFTDLGSKLEVYQKENVPLLVAENWSKTNKMVYLRQDVNLLFQNGKLKAMHYPWKQYTDWIVDQIKDDLSSDSVYLTLSFHHAEIHEDSIISSQHAVTTSKLYTNQFQGKNEFFKEPNNMRQEDALKKIENKLQQERANLLDQAMIELNINRDNYIIYDLDQFSMMKGNKVISEEFWPAVLGRLWEGLYRNYVLVFSNEELQHYSPSMPWILVDQNGTHLLVIYQKINTHFEKLIQQL